MSHNHWHRGPCCLTLWVTRGQRRDATAIHRAGTSPARRVHPDGMRCETGGRRHGCSIT
jgi:hypothetical protein